ncbi:MAG: nicotinamidase [Gammaproteobacteria bacterium]|nr:nicotinamidase [Gammaproteobacteria bacterium]
MNNRANLRPAKGDALIVVDVQNDFLPGGNLGVPEGDAVVPIMNRYLALFRRSKLPVYATRDWHPEGHCSFKAQGGPWPPHCVANSKGAAFASDLDLGDDVAVISKATTVEKDAYSGFAGTDLAERLRKQKVNRVFIGGLATDYCVLNTVKDALKDGFKVLLLEDGIRGVDVNPGDSEKAINEMHALGARSVRLEDVEPTHA